jgi:hypothetical protein
MKTAQNYLKTIWTGMFESKTNWDKQQTFQEDKVNFFWGGGGINPKQKNKNGDLYNGQLNLTHIAKLKVTCF